MTPESPNRKVPPAHLQMRVVGKIFPDFWDCGQVIHGEFKKLTASVGHDFNSFQKILDFGCGCGRVIQALGHPGRFYGLFGTDIDKEAIQWCRSNLGDVADFDFNEDLPPMRYENNAFDFIYSVSVFTHLPEELQFAWLSELRRILRPGGLLLATVQGPWFHAKITKEVRPFLDERGFLYAVDNPTAGLPDYYQCAFHTHKYIMEKWSRFFEVLKIQEEGISEHHDAVICRKRKVAGKLPGSKMA